MTGRAATFSESIVIKASPETSFAYLGDPATAPIVDPAVISYEPDTLPMGVGTVNTVRARLFPLPFAMTMTSRVLEWEPGRRMVIESIRPARPVKGTATHVFEPHPHGTLYTWSMAITPTIPGDRLFASLFSRFMQSNARKQQQRLKAILEREETNISQPGL